VLIVRRLWRLGVRPACLPRVPRDGSNGSHVRRHHHPRAVPPLPGRQMVPRGVFPLRRNRHRVRRSWDHGVEDGTRLRVPLPGGDGRPLFALVRTAPHPYFGRRGHDLTLRLPITLAEAALGSVVTVPTLAGAVAIRIPPGSTHGRVLRVRGHGISRGTEAGDLLVTVAIVVPASVNDAQRAALEAFAAATESPRRHLEGPVGDDRRQ
jgi:DnaJ-class molecular chaperone